GRARKAARRSQHAAHLPRRGPGRPAGERQDRRAARARPTLARAHGGHAPRQAVAHRLSRRRALRERGPARVPPRDRQNAPDPRPPAAHPPSAARRPGLPARHPARARLSTAGAACRGAHAGPSAHRPDDDLARAAAEGLEALARATEGRSLSELIYPDWPAPPNVRAVMTTRNTDPGGLSALLPAEPAWLRQVHGTRVRRDRKHGGRDGSPWERRDRMARPRDRPEGL